jgi:hypothetical protein
MTDANERLADIEQSYQQSLNSPCPDEKHCTCVPALRLALAAANERAKKMTNECHLWIDTLRKVEARAERLEKALRYIVERGYAGAAHVASEALRSHPEAE